MALSQVRPTFTLTIMLMMFVCQIFATFASASVQYASSDHPLGDQIAHHHSHNHADEHHHDRDNTITELSVSEGIDVSENDSEHEHEQNNHSHLSFFPPVDNSLASNAVIADVIDNIHSKYPNCKYAPPIPPPSV
ncbi:hypothetical protein [Cognaticolwellia mytili]|uniref:hypothetical protein n=1 Tax=Cognaticolwellia mytili TaxID=1888913 RepID=UPI000A174783|nr:hypothetical protein [Cognaticolwellia mytili]